MNAVGMFKDSFLGGGENSDRHDGALAGTRRPAGNLDVKFGDQRRFRTGPVGFVGQLDFDGRWNLVL